MDPTTLMSVGSGLAKGLTGGSATSSNKSDSMFDASGWNVQFGDGSITTDRTQGGAMSAYMPYLLLAGGLLIVWRFTRKKKSA
ncbi:MAG: hypothetical protein WBJ21_02870 [Burkholderiaceae bacterium]